MLLLSLVFILLLAATGWGAPAQQQKTAQAEAGQGAVKSPYADVISQVDRLDGELKGLFDKLDFIHKEYIIPQSREDQERFDRRLSRAEILIALKDYMSASVILYELVESPANASRPSYHDAMNILADTLFIEKNYFVSREYYKRLLQDGGSKHFRTALKRLIEIASITGSYEGLETYYALAKQLDSSMLSSEVYYVLGKSLYQRGDITRAMETFQSVADGSALYLRARYFIAAILVRKEKYDEAVVIFSDITKHKAETRDDKLIVDLAYMAVGRIYFDKGKLTEAADTYQRVDRNSSVFEESVFEVSWIYVKRKEYEKALQALDIMLMSQREDQVLIKAKILRGNLLLSRGRYEEAEEAFESITTRYDPIKDNLKRLLEDQEDPIGYFQKLAGEGLNQVEAQKNIPQVVIQWASMDRDVTKAFSVVQDLEGSRKVIDESFKIIEKIQGNLESENRIGMFPVLKEAKIRGIEVKMELDDIRNSLAKIEDNLVGAVLSDAERSELEKARLKREGLEKQINALPKTQEAYEKRNTMFAKRIQAIDGSLFNLGLEIEAIKAQITAVGKWYYDAKEQRIDDPVQQKLFHEKLTAEWNSINELAAQVNASTAVVAREKASMGLVSDMSRDEALRQEFRDALDAERKLVDKARVKLGGEAFALDERIGAIEARSKRLYVDLDKFEANLEKVTASKTAELREKVALERRMLESYQKDATAIRADTENVAGRIAYNGFRQVQRKFYDLVLQADIGAVDTAWMQKEDLSKSIVKLQTDLDKEMKALSDEFSEMSK
jgi:tetratricopeptide (TPR) repeat protein